VSHFQKAHGYIASLQRIDEQIAALFEQRRKAIEDMRAVQALINNEFERVLELDRVVPSDGLSQLEEEVTPSVSKPVTELKVVPVKETKVVTPAPVRLPTLQPAGS
jgi:uncharacterized UPF0160 family protein